MAMMSTFIEDQPSLQKGKRRSRESEERALVYGVGSSKEL
jgi:hypothetical protein